MNKTITALVVFAASVLVSTGAEPLFRWYALNLPVESTERSPFDSFMVRHFLSPDEQASLGSAYDVTEAAMAIDKGASVKAAMRIEEANRKDVSAKNLVRDWTRVSVNMWTICSTEDVMVCLIVAPDSSIIYLSGIDENENQTCKASVSYAGVALAPVDSYIYNGNLSLYVPKTKTGKDAMVAIRNTHMFSVSYACVGSSATYNFKAPQPLKTREVPQ